MSKKSMKIQQLQRYFYFYCYTSRHSYMCFIFVCVCIWFICTAPTCCSTTSTGYNTY